MALIVESVALALVSELRPLMPRIKRADRSLADQLGRGANSDAMKSRPVLERMPGGRSKNSDDAQFVGIVYVILALFYRWTRGDEANPAWLLALTVMTGAAWVILAPERRKRRRQPVTLASFVQFGLLVILSLEGGGQPGGGDQLFLLLIGSTFVASGLRGIAQGRIQLAVRAGPMREYTGGNAYLWSIFRIVAGVGSVAFAMGS